MDHSQHSLHMNDHSMHNVHTEKTMESQLMTTVNPGQMSNGVHNMPNQEHDQHVYVHANHANDHSIDSGNHTPLHHMMTMTFHFGYNEVILFEWWKISTVWGLVASMIGIFVMALLYEGLKYYREYLFWKTYNLLEYRPVTGPQANADSGRSAPSAQTSNSRIQYVGEVIHKQPPSMLSLSHFYQTFLHMVQVTLSFLLMLIFMTYNVWLCLAVVLGAAFGYFLFCWKKSVIVDVTEHCH